MDVERVMGMVDMLSERCLVSQESQRRGFEQMREAIGELRDMGTSLLGEARNKTQACKLPAQTADPLQDTQASWLIIKLYGVAKVENGAALGLMLGIAALIGILPWLLSWCCHVGYRRRTRKIIQVI